jgi:hypothetical protein
VTNATNRSATALALSTVLPFTASVISEADARRMAQSVPSKPMSLTKPSPMSRDTVQRMP